MTSDELAGQHAPEGWEPSWAPRARRAAVALCLALLLGLTVSYVSILRTGQGGARRTDFVPVYSAAHLVMDGHGASVYDMSALGAYERALVAPLRVTDGVMPYLYTPFFALALAPLGALPYDAAYGAWLAINLALLALVLVVLGRYLDVGGSHRALLWAAGLSFLPVFVALAQGQASVFLLADITFAFLALRARREVLAGVLLALIAVKLPYLAPFLLVLALQRRWKSLAACLATGVALIAVPTVVLGAGVNAGYVRTLQAASGWRTQIGGFQPDLNHSFHGFAQLLLTGSGVTAVWISLSLAALGLLAILALSSPTIDLPFAAAALVALLVSPHVLVHDLTVLLLPAAVAVRHRSDVPAPAWAMVALVYAGVMIGSPLTAVTHIQVSVLAMSGLGCWLTLAIRRDVAQPAAVLRYEAYSDPGVA